MRNLKRIVLSVVTGALVVLPMVGCDETVDGTDTINLPDVNPDTSLPDTIVTRTYSAVYILDHWDGINCGSTDPAKMSPGADIDAVELLNGIDLLGTFDVVRGESNPDANTKCEANGFDDPNLAKGAPDATGNFENYFSLHGGWIIGEFTNATEIQAGDTIKIYELGQSHPLSTEGNDEPYEAFIATEIACVDDADPQVNCMIQLTAEAEGTATLPVAAF